MSGRKQVSHSDTRSFGTSHIRHSIEFYIDEFILILPHEVVNVPVLPGGKPNFGQ